MLINQARNLVSLPYSALAQLEQSINQTEHLLVNAQRIAYSVTSINQAFIQTYPMAYSGSMSSQQLLAGAQTRWQNSLTGFQDAMRVQAGVVQNLDSTRTQITSLIQASQSATGALQAAQSGNQLTALQTKQLADLTAVMAAIARAESLENARKIENQLHRDLVAYGAVLARKTGQGSIEPAKLVAPMLARFIATDRAFAKLRRNAPTARRSAE